MDSQFVYDDGGRVNAGFKGDTGDCSTRAVAIATGNPYQQVYAMFAALAKVEHATVKNPRAKAGSPRTGVSMKVIKAYLETIGWVWTPTMAIGQGCTVHLRNDELPAGRIIARCSRHLVAVIDGVIHDTYDSSRGGTRCVYGYWQDAS